MVRGPIYTSAEDEVIKSHYPSISAEEISERFLPQRSPRGISVRASKLGVAKSREAYFASKTDGFTDSLTELEKAYIAGVIDGEGCITLYRREIKQHGTITYVLQVSIANTSKALIEWLQLKIPLTGIYTHSQQRYKLNGEPKRKSYRWVVSGNQRAKAFLSLILPYLVIKKSQAEAALSYNLDMTIEEREALANEIKELKQRA